MSWTWGDSIDASTDLLDPALWNQLIAAVSERLNASGYANTSGAMKLPATPPTLTPGLPLRYTGKPPYDDPLLGDGIFGHNGFTQTGQFQAKSIAEMQTALEYAIPSYWRSDLYPDGLTGGYIVSWPYVQTVPDDAFWTRASMGVALGYTGAGNNIWRRRFPLKIFGLDQTNHTDFDGWWVGFGGNYWQREVGDPHTIGDKAQYYAYVGPVDYGPFSHSDQLASDRVPGIYHGIYTYQSYANWVPEPPGSVADTAEGFGRFQPGDYFGWWLLNDIYQVCKLLKVTGSAPSPGGTSGTPQSKSAELDYYVSDDAATAEAANDSARNAATPTGISYAAGYGCGSQIYGPITAYEGDPVNEVTEWNTDSYTSRWGLHTTVYRGLAHSTDFYVFPTAITLYGSGDYDSGGTGWAENTWAKVATITTAAGSHAMGGDNTPVLVNYPAVSWGTAGTPGPPKGFTVLDSVDFSAGGGDYMAALTRWMFNYP